MKCGLNLNMNDDIIHTYKIQIKINPNSVNLSQQWLNEICKGTWSIGKNIDSYDLHFEYEEDALLTWWKWG